MMLNYVLEMKTCRAMLIDFKDSDTACSVQGQKQNKAFWVRTMKVNYVLELKACKAMLIDFKDPDAAGSAQGQKQNKDFGLGL